MINLVQQAEKRLNNYNPINLDSYHNPATKYHISSILTSLRGALGKFAANENTSKRWLFELRGNSLTMVPLQR